MVNSKDISTNTIEVLRVATKIYNILKNYNVAVNLENNIYSSNINNTDKRLLSIFLGFFFVDCNTRNRLLDYNINLDDLLDLVYDGDNNILFESDQFRSLVMASESNDIDSNIELMIKQMASDHAYISTDALMALLYETIYSGSRLIELFLPCVLEKCAPFADGKSFYEVFSRRAFEIEQEKAMEDTYIKEKLDKLNDKYSNNIFTSFDSEDDLEEDDDKKKYGEYLTDVLYEFNPAIGRERELQKAMVTLLTKDKSLILVGPGGVGKTAIVEGLAYDIQTGNVPNSLKEKKILAINTADLVSGCKYVGTFEKRIVNIFDKIIKDEDTIVFIDELHTVFGLGAGSNSTLDFANILKFYLGRGKIQVIGATTSDEYEKIIESDSAFKRRFERLDVKEPIDKMLFEIMKSVINKYENLYNIKFLSNSSEQLFVLRQIASCTSQSKRIYSDKISNPDLVILIIEKAFAYAVYNSHQFVNKDDVATAIMDCDRIYESVRRKTKDIIEKSLTEDKVKVKERKVIDFVNYRK